MCSRQTILDLIRTSPAGLTVLELRHALPDLNYNTLISGLWTLRERGLVVRVGMRDITALRVARGGARGPRRQVVFASRGVDRPAERGPAVLPGMGRVRHRRVASVWELAAQ